MYTLDTDCIKNFEI